jgi:hypothetical protein
MIMDYDRAIPDVASYGRTTWSRNILLSGARVDQSQGDNETKCCAQDRSRPYVQSSSHSHLPPGGYLY